MSTLFIQDSMKQQKRKETKNHKSQNLSILCPHAGRITHVNYGQTFKFEKNLAQLERAS